MNGMFKDGFKFSMTREDGIIGIVDILLVEDVQTTNDRLIDGLKSLHRNPDGGEETCWESI